MQRADIISGAVLTLVGVVTLFVVIPDQISGTSAYGLPPDFFPRLMAWLVTLLAAGLVLSRTVAWRRGEREAEAPPIVGHDWTFVTGSAVLLTVVWVVMECFGFIPAGALALAVIGTVMGELRSHPLRMLLLAVIAPPVVFYIFREAFLVFLPSW